ncbi:MAG: RagB/SusD family nutrient uptake outer membrane protein [Staphylococcus sp.]|nr:RagB/SusD family nutrient uptake outer membrane protein [Staphylococcus sp.]
MKIKSITLAFLASVAFASCSDDFLQNIKNYDNVSEEAYNYYTGASGRLDEIYAICLPDASNGPGHRNNSTGLSDAQSQCTEEYSGFGTFVNPQAILTSQSGNNPLPDYFQGQANSIATNAWGRLRNLNDVIRGISNSTLSQEEKDELLGQAYFLRAWCYYNFVKWYGGVPIITEVLLPEAGSFTPRSTTRECIEFMCNDLDRSAELLKPFTTNGGWQKSEMYGRVTTGTALALKGRILLMWASPLFNRANDQSRWEEAYRFMEEALPVINSCGYGLAYDGNPGVNASNWAKMFVEVPSSEAVFVSLYNTIGEGASGAPDYKHNNSWEHGIRPSNSMGGGGKTPSAMLVDMFPMKDGKRPASARTYMTLDASTETYDAEYPFLNRDPRFYRTFAFPGVRWAFDGDPTSNSNYNPFKGNAYELWNYVWYTKVEDRDNVESGSNYGPDNLLGNAKGFYIRKRTDDLDVNGSPRYVFAQSNGFKQSATPYMEIRYAEVLLNYAEAAAGAGHMSVAVEQLKKIRGRVGYTGDFGLQANLSSNQAACLAAVLYERQIELAYEGKRFDDMRRWMLFDGGAKPVSGAPATWTLTGWGGNTCTYLGFTPMNGQRRENLEFRVKDSFNDGLGGEKYGSNGENPDPLKDVARCKAVDYRLDLEPQLETLKEWYSTYLTRKKKKGDSYDSNHVELYIQFEPNYYLLGFPQGVQSSNEGLRQTIGWGDYYQGGANGNFDPLADKAE